MICLPLDHSSCNSAVNAESWVVKRTAVIATVVALLVLNFVGCSRIFTPIIISKYLEPVEFTFYFRTNDVLNGVRLEFDGAFGPRHEGRVLERIEIKEPSGSIRTIGAEDIEAQRKNM